MRNVFEFTDFYLDLQSMNVKVFASWTHDLAQQECSWFSKVHVMFKPSFQACFDDFVPTYSKYYLWPLCTHLVNSATDGKADEPMLKIHNIDILVKNP